MGRRGVHHGPFVNSCVAIVLVLLFVLVHKIGDTLSQLTLRCCFDQGHERGDRHLAWAGFGHS
jgi:hypothetical protein